MTATAVLHGFDPASGKVTTDVFQHEESRDQSPWHRAQALKNSVEGDFPGWIWSVGQNEASRKLMAAQNMRAMGLDPVELND